MKANTKPLQPDSIYHIYNRGINGCSIFKKSKDYQFFLAKYVEYVAPIVNTYAYCLMGNHFHYLIQVKSEKEVLDCIQVKYPGKKVESISKWISSQFAHMFNGYSQAFNKKEQRTGGLFESPFRRIEVTNDGYFSQLIAYIHHNPQKHGIINDFKKYSHSSYNIHLSDKETFLERTEVLNWFGSREQYMKFHANKIEKDSQILRLTLE